jgi:two-component system, chemotaxis family, CheB/CheR fusion protein
MSPEKSKNQSKNTKPTSKTAGKKSKTLKTRKSSTNAKTAGLEADDLIVVGIGASAGGLEAYKHVLPGLPTNANMAFVIVQHLDPKHRSMMASLLDLHTNMSVLEIADGQLLKTNTVYITPPGRDVKIDGNVL